MLELIHGSKARTHRIACSSLWEMDFVLRAHPIEVLRLEVVALAGLGWNKNATMTFVARTCFLAAQPFKRTRQ